MRFTRLKKAIESGTLNNSTGTILTGSAGNTSSASLSGGHTKGKAQRHNPKHAKAPTQPKLDNRMKGKTPGLKAAYLQPKTADPVVKMEIDDGRDLRMRSGNNPSSVREDDNDDEDMPLAVKRGIALAKKRHADSNVVIQDIKRRKARVGDQNPVTAIGAGYSASGAPVGSHSTLNGDMEIVRVGRAGACSEVNGVAADRALRLSIGHHDPNAEKNRSILPEFKPTSDDLQLRTWDASIQPPYSCLKETANSKDNSKQTQAMATLLDRVSLSTTTPSPTAFPSIDTPSQRTNSTSDTISISSASPMASPVTKPVVPRNPPLRPTDTLCTRYPGFQSSTDNKWSWRHYRLPHIVITDMEPNSPRNWLNPGSPVAIGKAEREVNNALFGLGSRAFEQRSSLDSMREKKASHGEKDIKQHLEIPRVSLEENPQDRGKDSSSERYIVLE
ncbi:hypothetical protein PRK78_002898 [Emydomyces testavorans]|uniref:Uncharacterized protein n=1 Tax=Emydomyces testavorans TaxID=2070801 RepID=A0AAF0II94_9EURO|nr:hypothetical protein PRK78_002898 [Emydomyces testavorans]